MLPAPAWFALLAPGDQELAGALLARRLVPPEVLAEVAQRAGPSGLRLALQQRLGASQAGQVLAALQRSASGTWTVPPPPPGAMASRPTGPTAAVVGGRIGPYLVERELARGGMGVVYVARHEALGRRVALKLVQGEATPELRERLQVEARAVARLRHPNLVAILEVGEHQGLPWLAMDLIEGESLAARLERDGPRPPREAAALVEKLARAVAYAHQQAVLHRDIKPHNVLVDAAGEPHLVDFGLAKDADQQAKGITVTGALLGTPAYMPPEQAGGELERVDRRADVYGLGATLFDLLTGRPPFLGDGAMQVVNAVLNREPPRPGALRAGIAADLETICLRCLEKEPTARYPTAGALADDLGRWLAGDPILARRTGLLERLGRRARRNRALTAALAVAALAAFLAPLAVALVLARTNREVQRAQEATRVEQLRAETRSALEEGYALLAAEPVGDARSAFQRAVTSARAGGQVALEAAAGRGLAEAETRRQGLARLACPGEGAVRLGALPGEEALLAARSGGRVLRWAWRGEGPPDELDLRVDGACAALVCSPRGDLLASAWSQREGQGTVVVWDLKQRRELWRHETDALAPGALAWSASGAWLALPAAHAVLSVFAAGSGQELTRLVAPPSAEHVLSAAFLGEGSLVAGYADGRLLLWDPGAPDGNARGISVSSAVEHLSADPEGTTVCLTTQAGQVELLRGLLQGGARPEMLLSGEAGPIADAWVAPGPGGPRVMAVTRGGLLCEWSAQGEVIQRRATGARGVTSGATLPSGVTVLGGEDLTVWPGLLRLEGAGPAAFAPDGARLAVACSTRDYGQVIGVWDVSDGARAVSSLELPRRSQASGGGPSPLDVMCLAFDGAESLLLAVRDRLAGPDLGNAAVSTLERRDLAGRELAEPLRLEGNRSPLCMDLGSAGMALGFEGRATRADLEVHAPGGGVRRIAWHAASVTGVRLLPDGGLLSASSDGNLCRWGAQGDEPLAALHGVSGGPPRHDTTPPAEAQWLEGLSGCALSPGGERVAVGCGDGQVRLFARESLAPLGPPLAGHAQKVLACAFLDEARLVSLASDGELRVWDLVTLRTLRRVALPVRKAVSLAVAPGGRRAAVCTPDGTWVLELAPR